jgi:hypothetical protein
MNSGILPLVPQATHPVVAVLGLVRVWRVRPLEQLFHLLHVVMLGDNEKPLGLLPASRMGSMERPHPKSSRRMITMITNSITFMKVDIVVVITSIVVIVIVNIKNLRVYEW